MNIPRETFPGRLSLVTAPTEEPVTLAEAKSHLRVDFSDDDTLISNLIVAARQRCETEIDRAFVTQTWDYTLETFPYVTNDYLLWHRVQNAIVMPKARLASVTALTYLDANGTTQTLTQNTDYLVVTGDPGAVYPYPVTRIWPYTRFQLGAVNVRFVCGYGAASAVPQCIKVAILQLVGTLYRNRESLADGQQFELPMGCRYLLASEAWGSRP